MSHLAGRIVFAGLIVCAALMGCGEAPPKPPALLGTNDSTAKPIDDPHLLTTAATVEPAQAKPPLPVEVPKVEAAPLKLAAHQAMFQVDAQLVAEMVRRNGEILVDWPTPKAALLLTGDLAGYIEPCGCAGLENQKGGMSRRHALLKQLREKGWPVIPLDDGGLVKRTGRQQEIKFQTAVEAYRQMGYQAIGWGADDLRLSIGEVAAAIAEPDGSKSRFVSANVGLFGADSGLTQRWVVIEQAGLKLGVTSVLADAQHVTINNPDIALQKVDAALEQVTSELTKASEFRVLLAQAEPAEARRLAQKFPDYQVIVCSGHIDEPPSRPEIVEGTKTILVQASHKGMYGVVLGLYDSGPQRIRYQRVPFDARFADSTEMHKLKTEYQSQLQSLGWEGVAIKPRLFPQAQDEADLTGRFVGSQKCGECHTKAFEVFQNTTHATATTTLVKLDPPRQFDAECISCHATGWHPSEYYPYISGFLGVEKTPLLVGNGCENCHGPGAAHVAAESGMFAASNPLRNNNSQRDKLRAQMRVPLGTKESNVCLKCHDVDNSPEFHLENYWADIMHKGKD